jgi:uncharacterized protein YdhG (YjbR/CyaY superfamily)
MAAKGTSMAGSAANVDEYLQQQPAIVQQTLSKMRKVIKGLIPAAEEVISYQIPTYKLNGPVAAFAGFKNHCSYFAMSHSVMKALQEDLEKYDTSGVTIRFPIDKPLPASLLKKLVTEKMKENKRRLAAKAAAKPAKKAVKKTAVVKKKGKPVQKP